MGFGFLPNGRQVAFVGGSGTSGGSLNLASLDGSSDPVSIADAVLEFWPSPDGSRIAFSSGDAMEVVSLDGGSPLTVATDNAAILRASFSPDGRVLMVGTSSSVQFTSLETAAAAVTFPAQTSFAFSPSGGLLAVCDGDSLTILSTPALVPIQQLGTCATDSTPPHILFTPDGRYLTFLTSAWTGSLMVWPTNGSKGPMSLSYSSLAPIVLSPDGSLVAFVEDPPESDAVLRVGPVDGSRSPVVLGMISDQDEAAGVVFSPDGHYLAFPGGPGEANRSEITVAPTGGSSQPITFGRSQSLATWAGSHELLVEPLDSRRGLYALGLP